MNVEEGNYNNDNSNNYSIKDIKIHHESFPLFRKVIDSKNYFSIFINKTSEIYINIHKYSFFKISQMINAYPEENIVFKFHHKILLTPHEISKISIYSNSSSLSNSIIESFENIDKSIGKSIDKKIDKESKNNKLEKYNDFEHKKYITNKTAINNKDTFIDKKVKNNSSLSNIIKQKLFLFKWIYHFYLISGIVIFLHYISFIVSEYNYISFYKYICIILIICLLYIGYSGVKNLNIKSRNYHYVKKDLFWVNFIILILTMITFIGLGLVGEHFQFVRKQGIIGYLIFIFYLTLIIVEAIYILYFDIINNEIYYIYSLNDNKINELSVQLYNIN
jgi:hypothetical protein